VRKLIVFDLDGTLAPSKSPIDAEMATLLAALLSVVKVAIISGGGFPQFQTQVVANLPQDDRLNNLSLLPTCGTRFYQYKAGWQLLYAEDFTDAEKATIISALQKAVAASGFAAQQVWGETIEDRGSQITYSALGQQAPLDAKEKWDPDFAKRKAIVALLDVDRRHQAGDRQSLRNSETARHPRDSHRGNGLRRGRTVSRRQ
jgi:hypothetical protein